jgi:uncharacterized RDD family membrane protein YckC
MAEKQVEQTFYRTVTVVGFNRRLLAGVIDGALVAFISFLVMTALGFVGLLVAGFNPDAPLLFDSLLALSGLIVSIAYYVYSWVKGGGQTLGKSVTGMKVVGADGGPLSWGQGLLRYVGYLVSAAVFSLGFIWISFDLKRQGWHDKIAKTYVIDSDTEFSGGGKVEFVPSDPGRSWTWLIIWAVLLILMPGVLLSSLFMFGPVVSRSFANFLAGLQ